MPMLLSAVCLSVTSHAAPQQSDGLYLLVAMHYSGTVEQYDCTSGKCLGTVIRGVPNANGLAWGPDGDLYVSSGAVGGAGKVRRYDGRTGTFLGDFVSCPAGQDGYLARGTGIAFHNGNLFVASCDNGKIIRYDGKTGAWLADVATFDPVSITQIRFHDGFLCAADFQAQAIRRLRPDTGAAEPDLAALPGFSPWGLAFGRDGALYWSGSSHTIQRFDGKESTTWAGGDGSLNIPIWLETGPDDRLYCSSHGANSVEVWSLAAHEPTKPVLSIKGPEMNGPIGLAFTRHALPTREVVRIECSPKRGDAAKAPSGGIRVEAVDGSPVVTHLGWDTEGGDRARLSLLRSPLELSVRVAGEWRRAEEYPSQCEVGGPTRLRYRIHLAPDAVLLWEVRAAGGRLAMGFAAEGRGARQVEGLRIVFPFSPRLAATTVISSDMGPDGSLRLPAIISAPDLGQMLVTCPQHPALSGRLDGDRAAQWVNLTVDLPAPDAAGTSLDFSPVLLPMPGGFVDATRWLQARRGWFNFLQVNAQPQGSGVWANNVISNPVSNTVFWLGDHVLLIPELAPGVSTVPLLRRTLDYWMHTAIEPDGRIHYTEGGPGPMMMDANPAALIAAWCYAEASGDRAWLSANIDRLEFIAAYSERRDIDGDGLLESTQSGNSGTHAFGDTAWDTYSSGHKNAYVNALAYRAFRCLADLERRSGAAEKGAHYAGLADRLKAAYAAAFYNPETGWLGWWRSQDGVLHDVRSDVPTCLAILYGLVGAESGRVMLDQFWQALEKTGFSRFDIGIPLNIRPVPRDDQFEAWGGTKEDGSDTFGKYLNGGCCVSNAYFTIVANYAVGRTERADRILDAMLDRQSRGVFPNGGGFQNGVINRYPEGAEFMDWDGNTCGYEGHLVYSWAFLQAMLLREPQLRQRLFRPLGSLAP